MNLGEKLQENAEMGADILNKYLNGKIAGDDKVKYASLAITQHCKYIATKGAVDAIKFGVGRSITVNPAEMKDFITRNMPEYNEVKKIGR